MNKTYEKYKTFDKAFKESELVFCVLSILFVTFLVTLGIVLKNFPGFSSPWTEEFCQYIMVWVVCIGGVTGVKGHEYANVDIIYNMLSQRLYLYYRTIPTATVAVSLAVFAYFSYLKVVFIKATARISATVPRSQMWWMYLGAMMGCGLMVLEYSKTIFVLFGEGKIKVGADTKDQDLGKPETM